MGSEGRVLGLRVRRRVRREKAKPPRHVAASHSWSDRTTAVADGLDFLLADSSSTGRSLLALGGLSRGLVGTAEPQKADRAGSTSRAALIQDTRRYEADKGPWQLPD